MSCGRASSSDRGVVWELLALCGSTMVWPMLVSVVVLLLRGRGSAGNKVVSNLKPTLSRTLQKMDGRVEMVALKRSTASSALAPRSDMDEMKSVCVDVEVVVAIVVVVVVLRVKRWGLAAGGVTAAIGG